MLCLVTVRTFLLIVVCVSDQPLEPGPRAGLRTRPSEVLVDHHDAGCRPAGVHSTLSELVLALQAFGMLAHLHHRGLAHIHVRVAA